MVRRILPYVLLAALSLFLLSIFATPHRSRASARRSSCQSNLKQLALALRQYEQDNYHFPERDWVGPIRYYAKTDTIFQCPETSDIPRTNDYFFNPHFLNQRLRSIKSPQNLILFGDGASNASPDATLTQIPAAWLTDENSPAWRHLGTANYAFADGHVKSLKPNQVPVNFQLVNP